MDRKNDETFKMKDLVEYIKIKEISNTECDQSSANSNINMVREEKQEDNSKNKQIQTNRQPNDKKYQNNPNGYKRNDRYNNRGNQNQNYSYDYKKQNKTDQNSNEKTKNDQQNNKQNKEEINEVSLDNKKRKGTKTSPPIKGKAIMNNSLVEFLCDGGADRSIINKSVYENICRQQPTTKLLKYQGKALRSCTGEIEILGIVKLDRCMLSSESNGLLKGVEIIVTNHSSANE